MYKKAQLTIEFVSVVFLGLIFVLTFSSIILYKIQDSQKQENHFQFEKIAHVINTEIEFAKSTLNGYSKIFELPEKISSENYNILIYNKSWISIVLHNKEFVFEVSEFEGQIGIMNHISKTNNTIHITKIK